VFLLSKAGTHGINLVSCRRIAVLEDQWNPVYNLQVGRGAA
jgi:SNF2 family DNA or RNA helicase